MPAHPIRVHVALFVGLLATCAVVGCSPGDDHIASSGSSSSGVSSSGATSASTSTSTGSCRPPDSTATTSFGSKLTVTDEKCDRADVTIGRPAPSTAQPLSPPKGVLYAVPVTITGDAGSWKVSVLSVVAFGSDGKPVRSAIGTSGDLQDGSLAPEQQAKGTASFDVTGGHTITKVELASTGTLYTVGTWTESGH